MGLPIRPSDLPPLPDTDDYKATLTELAEAVNGFVYNGERLYATLDTIKVLRANPELAHRLLETR